MNAMFYTAGAIAVISALITITRRVAMHALVNLVVAFVSLACVFWTLGAPFGAVLQIVVYAGAVMVLFLFAVMMLNRTSDPGYGRVNIAAWIVPLALSTALLVEFMITLTVGKNVKTGGIVGPAAVGKSLFAVYGIGVEIASVMLLAALAAAFHYGVASDRVEAHRE